MTPTELFYTIQQRLEAKRPTAVTRAGDGEAIVLNGFKDREKLEWVLKRQLGYVPSDDKITDIRLNLIKAYQESDYIGIPETKRPGLNEYWYTCNTILQAAVDLDHKTLTSVDFHNDWLRDGYFDQLLKDRYALFYIGCRKLGEQFARRYGIKHVRGYHIAPEMKFTPDYIGERHYPEQFQQIWDWMHTQPVAGNLCLVGAGVVGKIYNTWFKEMGGISLDVGNCMDLWAGLATRGKNRGVNAVNEIYKL